MQKKYDDLSALKNLISGEEIAKNKTEENENKSFEKQYLEAVFSKKGRSGKVVTIIKNFDGSETALKTLGKTLKMACGVGGSVKNKEIIIQGNHREKLIEILKKMGHQVKRIGG